MQQCFETRLMPRYIMLQQLMLLPWFRGHQIHFDSSPRKNVFVYKRYIIPKITDSFCFYWQMYSYSGNIEHRMTERDNQKMSSKRTLATADCAESQILMVVERNRAGMWNSCRMLGNQTSQPQSWARVPDKLSRLDLAHIFQTASHLAYSRTFSPKQFAHSWFRFCIFTSLRSSLGLCLALTLSGLESIKLESSTLEGTSITAH